MQPKSDTQLLREYAISGSEVAFAEIVARHTNLVYSAALRQVGSPDLARDVAQNVFTDLARKASFIAGTMAADSSLGGWLYRGTRYEALNICRGEWRRQNREWQHMQETGQGMENEAGWDQLAPILDKAMMELSDSDREAILMRYFQNQNFRDVGLALGVSEDTAQKRVSRALERLRDFFGKDGVNASACGLAAVISTNAVQASPVGLVGALSTGSLSGATVGTVATAVVKQTILMTSLQKALLSGVVAGSIGIALYQSHRVSRLQDEIQTLRAENSLAVSSNNNEAEMALTATQEEIERLRREAAEIHNCVVKRVFSGDRRTNWNKLKKTRPSLKLSRMKNSPGNRPSPEKSGHLSGMKLRKTHFNRQRGPLAREI